MTADRPNLEGNIESKGTSIAVFGHGDHKFKIPLSYFPNQILPNAPECPIYVDGKKCKEISELIEVTTAELQS